MKHTIKRHDNTIEINLTGIGNESEFLLTESGNCCTGKSTCSSDRYTTLNTFAVSAIPDGVRFELTSRGDSLLDLDEAGLCLDNAMGTILNRRENA